MRIFDEFRKENSQLNELIEQASRNRSVQGFLIELNSTWLTLWRLKEGLGMDWLRNRLSELRDQRRFFREFGYIDVGFFEKHINELGSIFIPNESWIPVRSFGLPELLNFQKQIYEYAFINSYSQISKLFVARVCLYPDYIGEQFIFSDTNENPDFEIVYEVRPISYLYQSSKKLQRPVVGGVSISIGQNDFSTLGGILVDSESGKNYGITCRHCIGDIDQPVFHPAKTDSKKSSHLGTVKYLSPLTPLPEKYYENRNLSAANEVDIALIEIPSKAINNILHIGNVTEILSEYNRVPNIPVSFTGRTSDNKRLLLTDIDAPFYDLTMDKVKYRFKDLIQIRLSGKIANFFSTPTSKGDSGAWICTPVSSGNAWCGMIIGGFEERGYAIAAEKILNWITTETNLQLGFIQ